MYFEVYKGNKLIRRGNRTLEPISFEHELMYVPECELVLPIDWLECFDGWEEVRIWINGKCFYGLVWDIGVDKAEETVTITVRHIISEWEHRQISVNHAMADKNLNVVYKGEEIEKDEDTDETITANDFSISRKAIKDMTTAKWIEKATAQAWKTSNGDKVAVTTVDADDVEKKNGTYKVKFSTAKGTSITVDCEVNDNINYSNKKVKKRNGNTITAKGFTADIDLDLTADEVKEKVKAKAWVTGHKDQEVDVTTITTNFRNEVGRWTVTASTAAGAEVSVYVYIESGVGYGDTDPAIVDKLEDIYNNMEFAYPGWEIDMQDNSGLESIDYVYSKQNKLEALTKTMELTDDLFWRVGWWDYKKVEIGKFGEQKPYTVSTRPSGKTNIRIISEPQIDYDFETVVNVATVYSDKSDSGMTSLTLREVYNDVSLQDEEFPVIILRGDVNNERDYSQYMAPHQPIALAPSQNLEYAVLDTESIALESGRLIEGAFAFNDLNPFNKWDDSKRVTDARRIRAAKAVYKASKRLLKQNRRSINFEVQVEEVPADLLPGDKVRLFYDNEIWNIEACSSYYRKMLSLNNWFYVTRITHDIDENEVETNTITLCKWIKIERDTASNGA